MRHFLFTLVYTVLSTTVLFQQFEIEFIEIKQPNQRQTVSDESKPNVELELSNIQNGVSWGSQIRYSIVVNDEVDGASKYNEINPEEVFLEIEFRSNNESPGDEEKLKDSLSLKGLRLIGKYSCFGCHADKETMIGPSFSDIANSYTNDESAILKLVNSIQHGSIGVWRDAEMSGNPEISEEDAWVITEYILMQGANKYRWVYPGFEGVFRVIDEPQYSVKGKFVLTASYTSTSRMRGEDTKVINIE